MARESAALWMLGRLDLTAPAVLAGPAVVTAGRNVGAAVLLTELSGAPLPWLQSPSLDDAHLTCRLLIEGVRRLHGLTDHVRQCPESEHLPHITVHAELQDLLERHRSWLEESGLDAAARMIEQRLPGCETPLVFSSGDYNPLNFLYEGDSLTGWVDFEGACFEDPQIGFAKFLIWSLDDYGWGTGIKSGLVERYLYAQNVSRREFAPRLALRCLTHLQKGDSIPGISRATQQEHVRRLLGDALKDIG